MAKSNRIFTVHGPNDIPTEQMKKGKMIPSGCPNFWKKHPSMSKKRGCYVFGIRASKGYTPWYVGKTAATFDKECFTDNKVVRYNQVLLDTERGTPIMFFVAAPLSKGKPNESMIEDLESFLIQTGVARNPDLLNVRGKQEKEWTVKGVLRSGKGKPSKDASKFRKMMRIGY